MNINELIKQYRTELGMTQEEVANKLFIAKNTYNQYEKGTRSIETNMFFNMLNVFGIQTDFSYEPSEKNDAKALVIYKDKTFEHFRFQIEQYDYDPVRKRLLHLETVNGGLCHPGWVNNREAMTIFEHLKDYMKVNVAHIEWLTYDDFDFHNYKKKIISSSTYTCSLGFLTRLFQKCIEEEKGIIPKMDMEHDYELLYVSFDENNEMTVNAMNKEMEMEEEGEDVVKHLFRQYLNKKLKKVIFDNERDVFHLFF